MSKFFILVINIIILAGSNIYPQKTAEYPGRIPDLSPVSFEGFAASTGINDFSYHSLRDDVTASMITRCTDGNMAVSWLTESLPVGFGDGGAEFIWLAAMDITEELHEFRVLVDGILRFTIISSGTGGDRIFEGGDGSFLEFYEIERDQHDDAHGYMKLRAPAEWLRPGTPLEITIQGARDNSNTWIIIYKATDAVEYLRQSSVYNLWYRINYAYRKGNDTLILTLPLNMAGSDITCNLAVTEKLMRPDATGNVSQGKFVIDTGKKERFLKLSDSAGDFCVIDLNKRESDTIIIHDKYVIESSSGNPAEGILVAEGSRKYNPALGRSLNELSSIARGKSDIFLMSSSHQDIAWMDSPGKCVIERDTMLLMPLFLDAQANPGIRFDIEDALMVREFVERHPEMKDDIAELFSSGRISCGSTFIQPYEEMYSGESLARQFYLGARWLKKEFNYESKIYWNIDVPGRTLQMPQVMKKSGTDFLVMSRFEKGLFKLESPDGSTVVAYSPGHYGSAYPYLQKEFPVSARYIADESAFWYRYSVDSVATAIPLLSASDMSPARDYAELRNKWNLLSAASTNNIREGGRALPWIKLVTANSFFDSLKPVASMLPVKRGERPAVWLYIHGPSHYEAIKASREADILLTMAEKFWAANCMVNDDFSRYPAGELNRAWEAKIYPDHGWGGKEGNITDNLFLAKFIYARSEAEKLLGHALQQISSSVDYNEDYGYPLFLFNSLNWSRDDVASLDISLKEGEGMSIELFDESGNMIPSQLTDIRNYPGGALKSATVTFIADDIPPVGYSTYYFRPADTPLDETVQKSRGERFQNNYFTMELDSRGICYLLDRETGVEIIGGKEIRGGEVFTMESVGNGAGEFSDIQQPGMEGYDYTGSAKEEEKWTIIEDGEVFTTFMIRQQLNNALVERRIRVYHLLKKIDIDVSLLNWDGTLFREFRMGLPLNMTDGKIAYEVPFGVVEVGKDEMEGAAGERYTTTCSDIHPRGIQNWIGASDERIGITMSSSVAVADYIDPRDKPVEGPLLQPLLLASRQSCHWEGNDYLQAGDHYYHFSFTTHAPGWENGYRFGTQANERLQVIRGYGEYNNAKLPTKLSFFRIDGENIMISTVKKSEDYNDIVIRAYDITGNETTPGIMLSRDYRKLIPVSMTEFPLEDNITLEPGISPFIGKYSIETFRILF